MVDISVAEHEVIVEQLVVTVDVAVVLPAGFVLYVRVVVQSLTVLGDVQEAVGVEAVGESAYVGMLSSPIVIGGMLILKLGGGLIGGYTPLVKPSKIGRAHV